VVQHAGRSTQRHVVVPFDARIAVAEHLADWELQIPRFARNDRDVALRDEDDDVGIVELCCEERSVSLRGPRRSGNEALRIEVVVRLDEQRAESPDGGEVGRRRGTNHFSWYCASVTFSIQSTALPWSAS